MISSATSNGSSVFDSTNPTANDKTSSNSKSNVDALRHTDLTHLSTVLTKFHTIAKMPGILEGKSTDLEYLIHEAASTSWFPKFSYLLKSFFLDGTNKNDFLSTLLKTKLEFLRCLDSLEFLIPSVHQALALSTHTQELLTSKEKELLAIGTRLPFLTKHKILLNPQCAVDKLQNFYLVFTQTALLDADYVHKLELFTNSYAFAAVVSLVETAYPINAFCALIQGDKLDSQEGRTLTKWVKRVEKKKHQMSVQLFHKALTEVVKRILPASNQKVSDNVSTLEWRLYIGGCTFLAEDDEVYIKWLSKKVYPTSRVTIGAKTLLIGEKKELPLPPGVHGCFNELPEDPSSLLFTGCNPAILGLWQVNNERRSYACFPVQVKEQDAELRYFIIERLDMGLVDIQWKTSSCEIHQDDESCIKQLVDFLHWLATNAVSTPKSLRMDRIFLKLTENGVILRTLIPFDDTIPHDFVAIEQFAKECAKENPWIFRHLMQASGLTKHPMAELLYSVACTKLEDEEDQTIIKFSFNRNHITDPILYDQFNKMIDCLIGIKKTLFFKLHPFLKSSSLQEELKLRIGKALANHQLSMGHTYTVANNLLQSQTVLDIERAIVKDHAELFKKRE